MKEYGEKEAIEFIKENLEAYSPEPTEQEWIALRKRLAKTHKKRNKAGYAAIGIILFLSTATLYAMKSENVKGVLEKFLIAALQDISGKEVVMVEITPDSERVIPFPLVAKLDYSLPASEAAIPNLPTIQPQNQLVANQKRGIVLISDEDHSESSDSNPNQSQAAYESLSGRLAGVSADGFIYTESLPSKLSPKPLPFNDWHLTPMATSLSDFSKSIASGSSSNGRESEVVTTNTKINGIKLALVTRGNVNFAKTTPDYDPSLRNTAVRYFNYSSDWAWGFAVGATITKPLSTKLSATSGLELDFQRLERRENSLGRLWNDARRITELNSYVVNIPVRVNYHLDFGHKWLYQVSLGLSNSLFASEKLRQFEVDEAQSILITSNTKSYRFNKFQPVSHITAQIGFHRPIFNRDVLLQPYISIPTRELGSEKVRYGQIGLSLEMAFNN